MAKKINAGNYNDGVVFGDMTTNIINGNMAVETLKQAIQVIKAQYSPVDAAVDAEVGLTTPQIMRKIASFCGEEFSLPEIHRQMSEAGFKVVFTDSIELGLQPDFYWLLKKN
jgi:hypothetical protein